MFNYVMQTYRILYFGIERYKYLGREVYDQYENNPKLQVKFKVDLYIWMEANQHKLPILLIQNNQFKMNPDYQINPDYQLYEQQYKSKCNRWRSQPVQNRNCNDVGCVIFFFIIMGVFIGIGAYYINLKGSNINTTNINFSNQTGVIGVCLALSVVLSFLYVFLIKMMPKCMVYFLMIFTGLLLVGGAIAAIVLGVGPLAIFFIIIFLIYCCVVYCLRDQIQMGIVLIKVASNFLSEKWGVFITPVIKIILTVLFSIFWFYSLLCIINSSEQKKQLGESTAGQSVLTVFWTFIWFFFSFIVYYIMVFTIAVSCSFWYYKVQDRNFLNVAYKWIFTSSFGSIVFGAALLALVTVVRMIVDQKKKESKNIAAAVCLCLISCCLQTIESLLKVLNHNSVIVMAVTGQDYISSAKTTLGLLYKYLGLMAAADLITGLIVFWGVIIISIITGFLSYFWLDNERTDQEKVMAIVVCVIGSIVVSSMVFSVLVQAVSSVFIFYCFDAKFKEMGYSNNNMPAEINEALGNYHYDDSK